MFWVVIFLGSLSLGLSSIAQAEPVFTDWMMAKKLDCPMTCKAKDMYVIMSSTNYKQDKPLNICATKIRGEWLVGYNRWKENTCTVGTIGKKVFHREKYFCLCTSMMVQPLR